MQNKYFETTIKYAKVNEKGNVSNVREKYVVSAPDLSTSEKITTKELLPNIVGNHNVVSSNESKYEYIIRLQKEADAYFYCVGYCSVDEYNNEVRHKILVEAENFNDCYKSFINYMKSSVFDYYITSISETNIKGIF